MGAVAGNTTNTPSLTHQIATYYKKKGLDVLRQMNRFNPLCEPDDLPQRSGKTVQWYRYTPFVANTTPHTEGVTGVSLTMGSNTVSATISEYADHVSISKLLKLTSISNEMEHATEELSYRASISVDGITRAEFDSNSSAEVDTIGATFTAQDVRGNVARLKTSLVRPKEDGDFHLVIHPLTTFDLQSDNTAGGFIDQARYANQESFASGEIGKIGGARVIESTNVKTSGTAPDVLYWSYLVGKGAVGAVDLAGYGPTKVVDPSKQTFQIHQVPGGPDSNDPEGIIGGYASYYFVYVAKTLDTSTLRFKLIKANASLV